jgi:hypothetical protein
MAADDSKREDVVEARRRFQEERGWQTLYFFLVVQGILIAGVLAHPADGSARAIVAGAGVATSLVFGQLHVRTRSFELTYSRWLTSRRGFDHYSIDADVTRWLAGTRAEVRKQIGPATGRRWLVRTWRVRRATRDALARRGIRIQWWEHPASQWIPAIKTSVVWPLLFLATIGFWIVYLCHGHA